MFNFGRNFEGPPDLGGGNGLPPSDGLPPWALEQSEEGEVESAAASGDSQRFLSIGLKFFEKIKEIS